MCIRIRFPIALTCAAFLSAPFAAGQDAKKPVAGTADVLRAVPKKFAAFAGSSQSPEGTTVKLRIDGDDGATEWRLNNDVEIKIQGWWGRVDHLEPDQRVWVWFDVDRNKKPVSVLMIADMPSEKDIHGQLTGDDLEDFNAARAGQRDRLRDLWRKDGLPGSVLFTHKLSGEMELMLDHEAMRWGRHLSVGDKVTIKAGDDIQATVKHVRPWRERTQVRLVTDTGHDQAGLTPGLRIGLIVPEPPEDVLTSDLPTGAGRLKDRQERIEWFLANIYCTCKISGDQCTGMFYTLASCNVVSCGMPNKMRARIGELIDEGKSDEEIFAVLKQERGPQLLTPHLLK